MFRAFWLLSTFLVVAFLLLLQAGPVRTQPNQDPANADIDRCWADLAGADAGKAYEAIVFLIAKREQTVAFLATNLPAAGIPAPQQVQKWIKDLNSARFADRDKGNRELEKLGGLAESAMRNALQGELPLEVRRRVDQLLEKLSGPLRLPEHLRAARAVEILEHIGSDSARGLLKKYAAGAPGARLTADAREAVERLGKVPDATALGSPPRGKKGTDIYDDPLPAGAVARLGTIRFRRDWGGLHGLAFLPDGKTILTVNSHAVQFWDAATGRLLRELRAEPASITNFAVAPDGKQFAVVAHPFTGPNVPPPSEIRIFALPTAKLVKTFHIDNPNYRSALAFSPDGKLLFSIGNNGILRIEDIVSGKELLQKKFPRDNSAHLAVSADGKFLAITTGVNTHKLFLWEWQTKEPRELKVPEYGAYWISFSPDGKLLATIGSPQMQGARVWEVPSGRLLYVRDHPEKDYHYRGQPAFTPDGKILALPVSHWSGGPWKTELVDPATGVRKGLLQGSGGTLAFSQDSQRMACDYGLGLRIWDLASRKVLAPNEEGHSGEPTHIVVSAKGFLATADDQSSIRLWDPGTSRQKRLFAADNWIRDIGVSPDGKFLAASSLDDTVRLWNTDTGREIFRLAGHGQFGGKRTLGFLPDGKGLLSWGDDYYLRLWDMKTGKAQLEHAIRPQGVKIPEVDDRRRSEDFLFINGNAAMTPDAKTFIWHVGGDFHFFDTATGKETRKFPSANDVFRTNFTISPDGKRLLVSASGSIEVKRHSVSLIDLSFGKILQQFLLPGWINGPVAFSADGRVFATSVYEPQKEIRLYEIASGKVRYTIRGFRGRVRSLAFFPDGRRLASGHADSTVLIWDLTSPVEIAKGK